MAEVNLVYDAHLGTLTMSDLFHALSAVPGGVPHLSRQVDVAWKMRMASLRPQDSHLWPEEMKRSVNLGLKEINDAFDRRVVDDSMPDSEILFEAGEKSCRIINLSV